MYYSYYGYSTKGMVLLLLISLPYSVGVVRALDGENSTTYSPELLWGSSCSGYSFWRVLARMSVQVCGYKELIIEVVHKSEGDCGMTGQVIALQQIH